MIRLNWPLVRLGALAGLLASPWPCPARAGGTDEVSFEEAGGLVEIRVGGRPCARYVFGRTGISRPYVEALRTPGGVQVTRNNPPVQGKDLTDHPDFHPGLWLAFGDLNGADGWRNKDRVRHAGFVERPKGGEGRGGFAVRNLHEKGGKPIGEEICRLTILARPSETLLLWDSDFRPSAGGELIFGDQEEMGLGIRLATPISVKGGGRLVDGEGRVGEAQVWGKASDWCAAGGKVEGRGVTVLLMPDPANFRRSWFHVRDTGLVVANPFGRNAFTKGEKSRVVVKPGESLRLRFGVLVSDSEVDRERAYGDFREHLKVDHRAGPAGAEPRGDSKKPPG